MVQGDLKFYYTLLKPKYDMYQKMNLLLGKLKKYYYEWFRIPITYRKTQKLHICNSFETIQHILKYNSSICRFGDGEFSAINGAGNGFQSSNLQLSVRLKEVLISNEDNVLIAIPSTLKDVTNYVGFSSNFWQYYTHLNRKLLFSLLSWDRQYYDSLMTRFYMSKIDKSQCKKQIELILKIWENREICIVEGNKTRSGIGNDLFSRCSKIERVICPAENAFDRYAEILETIKKMVEKNKLILISLGMTATVLAYDLARMGYQAIDLGHLDIEYEWYKRQCVWKTAIPGKYVNEAIGGNIVADVHDEKYELQIIANLSK